MGKVQPGGAHPSPGQGSGPVLWTYTGRKTLPPSTSLPVMGEISDVNTASLGGYLHSTQTRARWAEGFHELNGHVCPPPTTAPTHSLRLRPPSTTAPTQSPRLCPPPTTAPRHFPRLCPLPTTAPIHSPGPCPPPTTAPTHSPGLCPPPTTAPTHSPRPCPPPATAPTHSPGLCPPSSSSSSIP